MWQCSHLSPKVESRARISEVRSIRTQIGDSPRLKRQPSVDVRVGLIPHYEIAFRTQLVFTFRAVTPAMIFSYAPDGHGYSAADHAIAASSRCWSQSALSNSMECWIIVAVASA